MRLPSFNDGRRNAEDEEGGLVNLPLPNLQSMIGKKYRYKIDNNNEVTLKITGVNAGWKLITDHSDHPILAYEEAKFEKIEDGGRRRARVSRKRRSRSASKKNTRSRK